MKKGILASLVPIVLSFICVVILIVSGIVGSIKSGPDAVLEKFEKAIKRGSVSSVEKLYEQSSRDWFLIIEPSDLPYYGQNPNFIYEKMVENDGPDDITVYYAVIYEEDGKKYSEFKNSNMVRIDNKWYLSES